VCDLQTDAETQSIGLSFESIAGNGEVVAVYLGHNQIKAANSTLVHISPIADRHCEKP
jgi:hypothetical protein